MYWQQCHALTEESFSPPPHDCRFTQEEELRRWAHSPAWRTNPPLNPPPPSSYSLLFHHCDWAGNRSGAKQRLMFTRPRIYYAFDFLEYIFDWSSNISQGSDVFYPLFFLAQTHSLLGMSGPRLCARVTRSWNYELLLSSGSCCKLMKGAPVIAGRRECCLETQTEFYLKERSLRNSLQRKEDAPHSQRSKFVHFNREQFHSVDSVIKCRCLPFCGNT